MRSSGDCVVHTYGIVHAGTAPVLPQEGIGGTSVDLLELDELGVVVGNLPASSYGEAAWAAHGEDPTWLAPVARAHHHVLQVLVEDADVLPLRLPGIYPTEAALREAVAAARDDLVAALRFVSGHREWSVHVFLSGDEAGATADPAPASGRDYLLMRKQQAEERTTAREQRQQLAIEVYEGLNRTSRASVVNLPQDQALSGRTERMLLNSAHLVSREDEEEFLAVAEELNRYVGNAGGLSAEVSGPWPPYNFADVAERKDIGEVLGAERSE